MDVASLLPFTEGPHKGSDSLFLRAPIPMYLFHTESLQILEVNQAAVLTYGYSRAEFLRMTLKDIRPVEDVAGLLDVLRELGPQIVDSGVWRHRRKDGSVFWVRIISSPVIWAGEPARLVSAMDAEKLIQAHRRALEAEQRLHVALADSDATVTTQDTSLRYTWILKPSGTGRSTQVIGLTDEDVLGAPQGAKLSALKKQVLESGQSAREVISLSRDGEPRHYSVRLEPATDNRGAIVGVHTVAADITARVREREEVPKRISDALETTPAARMDLEEPFHNLKFLHESLLHDVQAPLRALLEYSQTLQETCDTKGLEEEGRTAHKIYKVIDGLSHYMQRVSQLSRLRSQHFTSQPLEAAPVLERVRARLAPVFEARGGRILIPPTQIKVTGNSFLLEEALFNLLSNAAKFVAPGVAPEVQVYYSRGAAHNSVRIWISDNGIGIATADRESIFMPLVRLHAEEQYPGSGMGLALAKASVEKMGGAIGVENRPSGGAAFWIEVPGVESWQEAGGPYRG